MTPGPENLYAPFRDPNNGLEGVFCFRTYRQEYTLVKVPSGVSFVMEYYRKFNETDIALEPIGVEKPRWRVSGTMDTNTYAQLGLPIHRERRIALLGGKLGDPEGEGENGPTVLPHNLEAAREFGQIEELGYGKVAGTEIYQAELQLPSRKITTFLKRIWVPDITPAVNMVVESLEGRERILPQKYPIRPVEEPLTRLIILKG